VWQWQDEKDKWNPYSASLSLELEEARESGTDSVDFEACSRSYTCNLKEMKQVNTITKVKRDLERAKSGRCSARSLGPVRSARSFCPRYSFFSFSVSTLTTLCSNNVTD
jgi:hypothetical protein